MKLSRFIPLFLFVLVVALFFWALFFRSVAQGVAEFKPIPLPEFSLPSALHDGKKLTSDALKNRVTIINLFASWCAPCKEEMPLLVELQGKQDTAIYGIAWRDDAKTLQAWLKENGNPFKDVGLDNDGKLVIALGLTGIPETYVVDKNQTLVFRHSGPLTRDIINNKILPLVKKLNE